MMAIDKVHRVFQCMRYVVTELDKTFDGAGIRSVCMPGVKRSRSAFTPGVREGGAEILRSA